MNRRKFLVSGLASGLLAMAAPASARSLSERIASQLRAQGYTNIRVSRTWLGRTRIVAQRGKVVREIVVNPRTGEILRDYSSDDRPGLLDIGAGETSQRGNDGSDDSGASDDGRGESEGHGEGDGEGDGGDD